VAMALCADGIGLLLAPLCAELELEKRHELRLVGKVSGVRARVWAVAPTDLLARYYPLLTGEETMMKSREILSKNALAG